MNRISVRGVAVASATAVTAVGAVVGVAHGSTQPAAQTTDIAGSTLLADIPSGVQAQTISDNIARQADAQQADATAAAQKVAAESARLAAAHTALAKADAEKAAAAAKAAAAQAAAQKAAAAEASLQQTYAPGSIQAMAESIIGNATQFSCFSNIVTHESGWDYTATNPSSGAYGLVQALPGSKMASAGADWRTNPATQIRWGVSYMDNRYGSPCGAWAYWQVNRSY
ncbi:transglycosylase SLT domain-containing protein [Streptacidiphilus albus]|uniref:aggregation-promoting factor C-terminal-like domain-containing protein n=1 Tax=Streptacidiphilus albus TaxID=105425 RepID=UPI00054C7121|nr:transglycosylase SLT domain-containing protein [Streptacidiphilus albus]